MIIMLNLAILSRIALYLYYAAIDFKILPDKIATRMWLAYCCDMSFELTMFINLWNWAFYYFKIKQAVSDAANARISIKN